MVNLLNAPYVKRICLGLVKMKPQKSKRKIKDRVPKRKQKGTPQKMSNKVFAKLKKLKEKHKAGNKC